MNVTGNFRASKCKRHLDIVLGKMLQPNPSTELDKYMPYIRAANVQRGQVDWSDLKEMWFSPTDRRKYTLKDGDLVVLEGGDVGRCAILQDAPNELGFQNSIHRVRARDGTEIRFAYYWMAHLKSFGYLDLVCSKATLTHFTGEKFAESPFPVVDLATQRQIADFLDRETARIDLLIEKKQRLVALLGEKKSASIDQIVNSQEWSEVKLSRLVRMIDGDRSSEYPSDQDFVDEGIPFISSKQIHDRVLTLDDAKFITLEKFAKLGRGKLQDGDIIVTVRGTLGNTAIFQKELATTGFINAQIMIMRPEKRVDPFLLHMFTQSTAWSDQIAVEGYGSAQKQLNQDVLRRFTARYPLITNPDRWRQVMSDLVTQNSMISTKTNASIDRIKEYRSALITAAVTGQIDVTTYAKSGTVDRQLDAIQEEMGA